MLPNTNDQQPAASDQRPATGQRLAANRANAEDSTGPRTEAGKQRSSMNALKHGLTATSPVLPTEDRAAYDEHRRKFFDQYKPANATESQLVEELVDTSWRLNRIPLLEAGALARAIPPADPEQALTFDIVATARVVAALGLHSGRLSRQFHKTLDQLQDLQAERSEREYAQLRDAAAILQVHKCKRSPWQPSDHGFVFSQKHIEQFAERAASLEKALPFNHGYCISRSWLTSTPTS